MTAGDYKFHKADSMAPFGEQQRELERKQSQQNNVYFSDKLISGDMYDIYRHAVHYKLMGSVSIVPRLICTGMYMYPKDVGFSTQYKFLTDEAKEYSDAEFYFLEARTNETEEDKV
jgi:hypothetical protein